MPIPKETQWPIDTPIGFVDASIVAIAERLRVVTILTTDRRYFAIVRATRAPGFELVR